MREVTPLLLRPYKFVLAALLLSLAITSIVVNPVRATGDQWNSRRSLPSARTYSGAVALNGRIHLVGGLDTSLAILSSNDVYDPLSDSWTALAPLPLPTDLAGVVELDGRIYAIGGLTWLGNKNYNLTDAVELYDPQTDTWTSRRPFPTRIEGLMVAAVNGLIYAIGGTSVQATENTTWIYNPQNDTWRSGAPMVTYDSSLAQSPDQVAVVGDKIYIFDQSVGSIGPNQPIDPKPMFNLVYDTSTDEWAHWPALTTIGARGNPISLAGHSMIGIGTRVFVLGGNDVGLWCKGTCSLHPDPSPVTRYNFEYDTLTGEWTRRADMLTGREGLVTASVNGVVYAFGGATDESNSLHPLTTGYTDHNEAYTPCSGYCPPFQPKGPTAYLAWSILGIGSVVAAGLGFVARRAWMKRKLRPPMRPLEPITVSA